MRKTKPDTSLANKTGHLNLLTTQGVPEQGVPERLATGFAQKVDPIWNGPAGTGNAGALARYEREARNSYSVKKVEIERAAHALRARAPAKRAQHAQSQPS